MQLFERLGISPEPFHVDKTNDQQEAELHQTLSEAKTDSQFYRAG
jgi:biotin synthase